MGQPDRQLCAVSLGLRDYSRDGNCVRPPSAQATHYLQRAAHVHRDTEKASYALRPAKTYLKIWMRFQTEIMVLGCLAFTIWVANQCGGFDAVAEIKGGSTGPGWDVVRAYRDAVARRKACKNECADAEKGVDDAHRRLLGAAAENEGSSVPLYLSMCPTRWPSDGAVILHVFERIHFVLFVTAFFYFFSLAVIYFLFTRPRGRARPREPMNSTLGVTHCLTSWPACPSRASPASSREGKGQTKRWR